MQVAHPAFENESNIPGEAIRAGINTDALDHIISILTNLYSDAVLAVIREYSCNAYDAQVEAGISKPIEVTLPTPLAPTFKVKDWGVGLSEDQILPVFLTYGAGTKSQSNDQIGGFGIGSKSAFTIAHEFTITSVKDGHKVVVLFSLDAYGVPVYKIVYRAETDEPNGVEVSLPVDDYEAFRDRAAVFFSTWQPGTVLIDGKAPRSAYDDGLRSGAVQFTTDFFNGAYAAAVVGQVAYPLHQSLVEKVYPKLTGVKFLVDLPIGSVDIAPSREALRDTPRTIKALTDALTDAVDRIAKSVAEDIENAPTFSAAARALKGYSITSPFLDLTKFSWNGTLIKGVRVSNIPVLSLYQRSYYSEVYKVRTEQVLHLDPTEIEKVLVVRGAKSVLAVSRFAKRYLENNEDGIKFIVPVLEGEIYEKDWFVAGTDDDAVPSITAEEYRERLKAWAPATVAGKNAPRYSEGFYGENDRDSRTDLAEILENAVDDEVIVFRNDRPADHGRRFLLKGKTVVTLTGSQSWDQAVKNFGEYFVDGPARLAELTAEYAAKGAPKRIRKAAAFRAWWDKNWREVDEWVDFGRVVDRATVELTNPRLTKVIANAREIRALHNRLDTYKHPDYQAIDQYVALRSFVKSDLLAPLPGVAREVADPKIIPALVRAAARYDHTVEVANEIVELLNSKQ